MDISQTLYCPTRPSQNVSWIEVFPNWMFSRGTQHDPTKIVWNSCAAKYQERKKSDVQLFSLLTGLKNPNNLVTNCNDPAFFQHVPTKILRNCTSKKKKYEKCIYSGLSDIFPSFFVEHLSFPPFPTGLAGKPWRCKTSMGKMGLAELQMWENHGKSTSL